MHGFYGTVNNFTEDRKACPAEGRGNEGKNRRSPHSTPIRSHMECSDEVGALDSRGARSRLEDPLSLTLTRNGIPSMGLSPLRRRHPNSTPAAQMQDCAGRRERYVGETHGPEWPRRDLDLAEGDQHHDVEELD